MVTQKSLTANVLIVGGGPAGLAAALMLAKRGSSSLFSNSKSSTFLPRNLVEGAT